MVQHTVQIVRKREKNSAMPEKEYSNDAIKAAKKIADKANNSEIKKKRRRKYTGINHLFHNYEDGIGRTHCTGPPSNPYEIECENNTHIITKEYARGHGLGNKPQWFKFEKRLGKGWDLSSGIRVDVEDVPSKFKA